MKNIYLDYAAATPISEPVQKAMEPYAADVFYNPSALYSGARAARQALESARSSVGRSLGARPSEIIFTAGGTESANLAICGIADMYPDGQILVSAIEHDAVLKPALVKGAKLINVTRLGIVDLQDLSSKITDKTVLVSVMYANNEVGTVQPISDIVELVAEERKRRMQTGESRPIYVHTDACQAPQYLDCNVARLGVDLMTLNGGKMYGPKQSGVLYHRTGVVLRPLILGGGQEFGYRSGTENVAACVGFATALETAIVSKHETIKYVTELSRFFVNELEERFGAVLNGHRKHRLPNNIHVTFPRTDNERVLFSLDDQGVFAAAGSACSASSEESSHVLLAMGLSEDEARSSVRFSLGKDTTQEELELTLNCIEKALEA